MKLQSGDFWLSEHFRFYELTDSHDHPELVKANREYFLRQPFIGRITVFAESMLEEIRFIVGTPVVVNNCGRFPALNVVVGGVKTSQHLFSTEFDGAADITIPNQKIEIIAFKIFNGGIRFYQMRVYTKKNFIHIGSPRQKNNGQIMFPESVIPGWAK